MGWQKRPRGSGVIVNREFNYATPENDFKQITIHPKPGDWNVWNISDGDVWRQKKRMEGCLFDRQYSAKPAYYALQGLLENPPDTNR